MENIIMATFPVESEAYQAFSELKRDMSGSSYFVSQAVLVKKEGNSLRTCEQFDTGVNTEDDTVGGSLIGSFIGILGGPIGVLLGAGVGGLIGAAVDSGDIEQNGSAIEKVSANLTDGTVAILAFAQEDSEIAMDSKFSKFNASISRFDAAEIASEIEDAQKAQKELEKQIRDTLRKEKNDARKAKIAEKHAKMTADFTAWKEKLQK